MFDDLPCIDDDEVVSYEEDLSPVMFDNPNYEFPNVDQLLASSSGDYTNARDHHHRHRMQESASEGGSSDVSDDFGLSMINMNKRKCGSNLLSMPDSLCSSVTSTSSFLPPLQQALLAVEEDDDDDDEIAPVPQSMHQEDEVLDEVHHEADSREEKQHVKEDNVATPSQAPGRLPSFRGITPLTERMIYSPCSIDSGIQSQPTSNYDLAANSGTDGHKRHQTAYKASSELGELAHCWEQHEENSHLSSSSSFTSPPSMSQQLPQTPAAAAIFPSWASKLAAAPDVKITMDKDPNWRARTMPHGGESEKPRVTEVVSYAVHCLGQVALYENEVTPERSSRTVNRCIQQLTSSPKRDLGDCLPKWAQQGQDLTLQLTEKYLLLYHTDSGNLYLRQPILSIRVWGVGHSNLHDFAYVSRDPGNSRRYLCHVLRCDEVYANEIATHLCSLCRRLAKSSLSNPSSSTSQTRTLHEVDAPATTVKSNSIKIPKAPTVAGTGSQASPEGAVALPNNQRRPQDLPGLVSRQHAVSNQEPTTSVMSAVSHSIPRKPAFATPIEEPRHAHECRYLGTQTVAHSSGVRMINTAIDRADAQLLSHDRERVRIFIAPSTIVIHRLEVPDAAPIECRIRFLSFMAVSKRDPKLCGFIIHTASNEFVCHVFESIPDATHLSKLIESACQLRYHMCMDARVYALSSSTSSTSMCSGGTPSQEPPSSSGTGTGTQSTSKSHIPTSWSASTLASLTPSTPRERVKEGLSNVIAYLGWSSR